MLGCMHRAPPHNPPAVTLSSILPHAPVTLASHNRAMIDRVRIWRGQALVGIWRTLLENGRSHELMAYCPAGKTGRFPVH